jgi:predicted acetyltransferase
MRIEIIDTDLAKRRLNSIAALKSQHWSYPIESQIKWLMQNVAVSDKHVLGWNEATLIGYLRIVSAQGMQGEEVLPLAIVDTVCIDRNHRRRGLGLELMGVANRAINHASGVGLLACPPSFVHFYERCRWTVLSVPLVATAQMRDLLPENNVPLIYDPMRHVSRSPLRVSTLESAGLPRV